MPRRGVLCRPVYRQHHGGRHRGPWDVPSGGRVHSGVDNRRLSTSRQAGEAVLALLEQGIRPRDILTREAFENSITVVAAMGGSTNAVLHLLAIAHEANVDLNVDDFDMISSRTPYIADMRPSGRYVMADLDKVGGVPLVMKLLLAAACYTAMCLRLPAGP